MQTVFEKVYRALKENVLKFFGFVKENLRKIASFFKNLNLSNIFVKTEAKKVHIPISALFIQRRDGRENLSKITRIFRNV
jgi:hypothetical protein